MQILHFRRTFVEKLFTIHSHVLYAQEHNQSIETYARHYYDLFYLSKEKEVLEMLKSDEYLDIKRNCDKISQQFFNDMYYQPKDLSFANSKALFPTEDVRSMIVDAHNRQCKNLCYGDYPAWEQVEDRFNELREYL